MNTKNREKTKKLQLIRDGDGNKYVKLPDTQGTFLCFNTFILALNRGATITVLQNQ
jgi:hypothetical protein